MNRKLALLGAFLIATTVFVAIGQPTLTLCAQHGDEVLLDYSLWAAGPRVPVFEAGIKNSNAEFAVKSLLAGLDRCKEQDRMKLYEPFLLRVSRGEIGSLDGTRFQRPEPKEYVRRDGRNISLREIIEGILASERNKAVIGWLLSLVEEGEPGAHVASTTLALRQFVRPSEARKEAQLVRGIVFRNPNNQFAALFFANRRKRDSKAFQSLKRVELASISESQAFALATTGGPHALPLLSEIAISANTAEKKLFALKALRSTRPTRLEEISLLESIEETSRDTRFRHYVSQRLKTLRRLALDRRE